jgi:D-alanyl-D-alanine carboxypeptidase
MRATIRTVSLATVAAVALGAAHAQPDPTPWLPPGPQSPLGPAAPAGPDPVPPPAEPELPDAIVRTLRTRLQERLDAHREAVGAPGANLAIVLPGGQEVAVTSGVSHRGQADYPLGAGDRMPSGSVGKTYCAAIALLLVEEGTLDLDAPISAYIGRREWFGRLPNAAAITARHLLNHTSGLREHVTSPAFTAALRAEPWKEWTPEELIAFALDTEPLFVPGEGWSYADTNFIVLGHIIETITGRPYNDLLRERLLEPLGLVWTDPTDRPDLWGLIPGYTDPANPFGFPEQTAAEERYCVNPQFEYTGGGTITTAGDLARWADHLYGGRVVSAESLEAMTAGVESNLGPGVTYGLGTIIWPTTHGPAHGHSGWFPGFISMVHYYPDLGVSIAYQQNTDVRGGMAPMRRLLDAAAGQAKSMLDMVPLLPPAGQAPPEPGVEPPAGAGGEPASPAGSARTR